jgi:hypothetical protein
MNKFFSVYNEVTKKYLIRFEGEKIMTVDDRERAFAIVKRLNDAKHRIELNERTKREKVK